MLPHGDDTGHMLEEEVLGGETEPVEKCVDVRLAQGGYNAQSGEGHGQRPLLRALPWPCHTPSRALWQGWMLEVEGFRVDQPAHARPQPDRDCRRPCHQEPRER